MKAYVQVEAQNCTRSSSNSRHRLLVSGNLSVSLEDRKHLRRNEQLQKFHVDW